MSPMQIEIQERVKQQISSPIPVVAEAVKSPGFLNKFLASCIVILTVVSIGIGVFRYYHKEIPVVSISRDERPISQKPIVITPDNSSTNELNRRMDKMDATLQEWMRRVWLLSLAHNENVNMIKQYGTCAPNYLIYFDPDWKLSRFPNSLQMNDEIRQEIQKNVR